jgi:hypothetical protein
MAAGYDPPVQTSGVDSTFARCATTSTEVADTTSECATSPALLLSPQLQEAVHDLRRLGLATAMREVGRGRVAVNITEAALAQHTPLAYHLERMYRAYRNAYDYGDAAALELWRHGQLVGIYTSQGLLLH